MEEEAGNSAHGMGEREEGQTCEEKTVKKTKFSFLFPNFSTLINRNRAVNFHCIFFPSPNFYSFLFFPPIVSTIKKNSLNRPYKRSLIKKGENF